MAEKEKKKISIETSVAYMPSRKKQVLDQQIPLMKDMTTKRLLIGFGYYSW
jgi:hypothetical protein